MVGDFSANASYLGYLYQSRYALLTLISAETDNPAISLEIYDDISFEDSGTIFELIQTKHHLNSRKTLSNASEDFWKTIRIWCAAIKAKQIDLDNIKFFLITTETANDNSAASLLRPNSQRNESVALDLLVEVAQTFGTERNRSAYEIFLSLSPSEQAQLIQKINIIDASPDIIDVKDKIKRKLRITCRERHIDSLFQRLEGWWLEKIIIHLKNPDIDGGIIYQSILNSFIQDLNEQFHSDNLPIDFLDQLDLDEQDFSGSRKIFIRQLELVMIQKPRIKHAISDYYRAFQQRSKWIREDLLLTGELERYEKRLIGEWSRLFETMKEEIPEGTTEEQMHIKGRDLFNWIEQRCEINIRPRCTDPYVMRGSYHMLADDLKIGWHVDFVNKLEHLLNDYME